MPIIRQETGLNLSRLSQTQDPADGLVLYKGNCHCGKNTFEVHLSKIDSGTECTCSLCHKSGYLWAFPINEANIKYTSNGDAATTLVTFETEALSHQFCSSCGTGLYGTHKAGPLEGQVGVNIRTILDVNPFKLETDIADTASTIQEKPINLPPALTETEPPAKLEGDNIKIYTGSCQCGAVSFAVKTPPLSEVEIKEDNCSICVRRAAITIYPDIDQVTLLGSENTTNYAFGRKFNHAPFCKTCGVACYGVPVGPPQEIVDKLPEEKQKFVEKQRRIRSLYVRAMNDVQWDDIKVVQSDEGTEGYVVPIV